MPLSKEKMREYQRRRRAEKKGGVTIPETAENVTEEVVEEPIVTLSVTDRLFDQDRPGWYVFGEVVKERKCWKCGEGFETRLEMNKFCSPECKDSYLREAFDMGKKDTVSGSQHEGN